ncbi:MAG: YafY family transcriptional regulator [Gammaproteobacteria bacterium]|nr:YafY family transcriptional regulator [Gammaproteobacteria bacterium]MDH5802905.1 YafY family transcriptional regulator [Gammaproteobacteria bacterium]
MRRADRLFQIIQLLRGRRLSTAKWLAQELEISERTVYRDIQDLMASGVPIEGEAGVGYVMRRGFDLPPLMFTREELTALTLGARIVQSWADQRLAKSAEQVLEKVEAVLPDKLKQAEEIPLFSPMTRLPPPVADTFAHLRFAIEHREKLQIGYMRKDGKTSQRIVWPLGLFFWGQVWTLTGWCELRDNYRNFRVDRIQETNATGEQYPQNQERSLQAYLAEMKACYPEVMERWT